MVAFWERRREQKRGQCKGGFWEDTSSQGHEDLRR